MIENLNDAANRFIRQVRSNVHLMKTVNSARHASHCRMLRKSRASSAVASSYDSHQVFGPMTNWSLVYVLHDNFLSRTSPASKLVPRGAKLLQAHLQLSERRVKAALHRAQRHTQNV